MNNLMGGALAVGLLTQAAVADCRQALAIGLDVSGSVDLREYRLQLDGLVTALNHPDVVSAFLSSQKAYVSVMVFEWSGPKDHLVLVPWVSVTDESVLGTISETLAETSRRNTTPGTALGLAMAQGAQYLDQRDECWKRTLDISGDGPSNFGPRPRDIQQTIATRGYTINALVIGSDTQGNDDSHQSNVEALTSYFRAEVITGPDAFVQTSSGFEAYAEAMAAKLKRELGGIVIGRVQ